MAMRNPYSAYQQFAKKNPAKPTAGEGETTTSTSEKTTAAPPVGAPATTSPTLASVKEGFQPARQKPINPKMYEMKKKTTLSGENGQERVKMVEVDEETLDEASDEWARPVEKKPVNPYLQSKVMTASPEELVLMLYDGAIRFMNQAVVHLEAGNKPSAHESSIRAQAIVAELMGGLNMDIELSRNLMSLYDYLQYVMVGANIDKDVDKSRHAIELLRELRETWQEAMKLHRAGK